MAQRQARLSDGACLYRLVLIAGTTQCRQTSHQAVRFYGTRVLCPVVSAAAIQPTKRQSPLAFRHAGQFMTPTSRLVT